MHLAAGGDGAVLAVLGEDDAERAGGLERLPHHDGVLDAGSVVGEEPNSKRGHLGKGRHPFPGAPQGDRPRDRDVGAGTPAEFQHVAHGRSRVGRRLGVRHRDDGGVTAERGRARPGLDGLRLLAAGFAQVRVDVDEPGRDETTRRVENRRPEREVDSLSDRGDEAVLEEHVAATRPRLIDDGPAAHDDPPRMAVVRLTVLRHRASFDGSRVSRMRSRR